MRVIEKFVCDQCSREYYDKLSVEKCELMHKEILVLGSYLTHLGQVPLSGQIAVEHIVNCDWCKANIRENEWLEKRDLALQRVSDALKRE